MDSDTDFRTLEFTGRHISRGYIFIYHFALNYIVCEQRNVRSFLNIYRYTHSSRFYILQQFPKKIMGAGSARRHGLTGVFQLTTIDTDVSGFEWLAFCAFNFTRVQKLHTYSRNHSPTLEFSVSPWTSGMRWDTFQCLARAVGYRLPGLMITI